MDSNFHFMYSVHPIRASVYVYFTLGRSHYIVWSTRSPNMEKSCPTRKKIWHFILFFFFPPSCAKNLGFFFSKLPKYIWNLLVFNRKSNFPTFFFIFSSDQNQNQNFYFYFFSSDKVQNTLVGARRPNNIVSVALGTVNYHW